MHTPLGSQNPPQSPLHIHNKGAVMQNYFDLQTKHLSLSITKDLPFRYSLRSRRLKKVIKARD